MFQNQWSITKFIPTVDVTTSQREKNIGETLFVIAGTQEKWKTTGSGSPLPQYLPNPKTRFPAKFILT